MYNASGCTYDGLVNPTRVRVTRTGQVSLPAELRHRWGVGTVLVIDRGDYAIVRPIPADPVATLRGAHAGPGPASERVRADEHAAEEARESGRRVGK
jgi:bifunctional DNA-binding transcriptional regulator/antitoxin component of YhaV-PrlF toxin-antitoxin module